METRTAATIIALGVAGLTSLACDAGYYPPSGSIRVTVEAASDVNIPGDVDLVRIRVNAGAAFEGEACRETTREFDLGRYGRSLVVDLVPQGVFRVWAGVRAEWYRGGSLVAWRELELRWPESGRTEARAVLENSCRGIACNVDTEQCQGGGCVPAPGLFREDLLQPGAPSCDPDQDAGTGTDDGGGCLAQLGGECNVNEQCGCAAGGDETCRLLDQGGSWSERCMPVGGPLGRDAPCDEAADQCAAGLQCLASPALPLPSICRQPCRSGADCLPNEQCTSVATQFGVNGTDYGFCDGPLAACDPLDTVTGTACHGGNHCALMTLPPYPTVCQSSGSVAEGESCALEGCRPGFGCYGFLTGGGDPLCRRHCDLRDGDPGCASSPGTACYPWFAGRSDVGLCTDSSP